MTRRQFLARTSVAVGSLALPVGAASAAVDPNKVLVTIFLRGAADGLNLVIPAGDPLYYDLRPQVAVPDGSELALTSFFALHPKLGPLRPLFNQGKLAFIHAVGSPDPTRSHFDAQDFMLHASPGDKSVRDGWLNRYLTQSGVSGCFSAVAIGSDTPESLAGDAASMSLSAAGQLLMPGLAGLRPQGVQLLFRDAEDAALKDSIDRALECADEAALVGPSSTGYPASQLGEDLRNLAALIKADVGVHVAAVDNLGWDTHQHELNELDVRCPDLANALKAFHTDLGSHADRTLVLVMTEFGRRVRDNTSGTDHGHGSVMIAMGGGVNGGQVYMKDGLWPGLADQDLYEGRDLQVTTDFRDVFGEVLVRFLGLSHTRTREVLLDYGVPATQMPGLFA